LKKLIEDRKHVFSLFVPRSADIQETALHVAILNNDIESIKLIAQEVNSEKKKDRIESPTISLKKMGTGCMLSLLTNIFIFFIHSNSKSESESESESERKRKICRTK
jgi:hypothetical protein